VKLLTDTTETNKQTNRKADRQIRLQVKYNLLRGGNKGANPCNSVINSLFLVAVRRMEYNSSDVFKFSQTCSFATNKKKAQMETDKVRI